MPEIAEVKLTSEFISSIGKKTRFKRIEKSPVSKVKTDLNVPYKTFTVDALSRGKEMMVYCIGTNEIGQTGRLGLKVGLGMSGTWIHYDPKLPENEKYHKHTHLRFIDENDHVLGMCDIRRFGKWTWSDFDERRGPCPISEELKFADNLRDNWEKHKDFKKHKLSEILMSQKWFNGVGNYLRAEILYRLDRNPFMIASDLKKEDLNNLIALTIGCAKAAYKLGGGQLKDWKNPTGEDPSSFKEWMKCYGKLEKVTDGTGRTFWFDTKWKDQ
jgi:endonuclease VIII-like 1